MAFLVRGIHVGSVTFVLGGALLLILVFYFMRSEQLSSTAVLLKLMQAYEFGFWAAIGLLAATGIGNIAHFGDALPAPDSAWGGRFLLKMYLVLMLMLLSAIRVIALHLVTVAPPQIQSRRIGTLEGLYGATAALAAAIGGTAVALAHF